METLIFKYAKRTSQLNSRWQSK